MKEDLNEDVVVEVEVANGAVQVHLSLKKIRVGTYYIHG